MLDHILIPLDGSALADSILAKVRRLLLPSETRLTLLMVVPPEGSNPADFPFQPTQEEAESHMDTLAAQLVDEGISVSTAMRAGEPAEMILSVADELLPSLIAMSTVGRTATVSGNGGRWQFGSIAERLLRHTRVPLLLATPTALAEPVAQDEAGFHRILVPLDGSEQSARILPLVSDLATLYSAEVTLFHVWGIGPPSLTNPEKATEEAERLADSMLAPHVEALEKKGITVSTSITSGAPSVRILEAANSEAFGLVAMTTHGHSGLSRWVYGSVAEKVVREYPCPLLVLRTTGAP